MAEPEPMETTTAAETGAPAESPVAAAAEEENMSGDEEDLFGAISDDDAGSADDDAVEAGAGPGADEDSTANNSNSLADVDLAAAAAEADALPDPQGDGDNDDDDGGAAALGLVASDDDAEDDDVVYKTYTEDGPAMEVVLGPVPKVGKEVYSVKMPNFLAVEPEPYTREDYVDPNDARKAEDDDKLVIPCEYYVRWRTNAEGKPESNTRLVEWEDGSWHLFVGSEAFEAQVVRETQYREIGIRQLDSIETLGATVGGRISFRPVDINSKAHKLMTRAVASRSQAAAQSKIKTTVTTPIDAAAHETASKAAAEVIRARRIAENERRRTAANYNAAGYLEDSRSGVMPEHHEYDDAGVEAWRNKRKRKPNSQLAGFDDDQLDDDDLFSDSDDDAEARLRQAKNAALPPSKRRKL
ncbi:uncharacterized protein AMSG_07900 [Thecamonas trahens ATCC 50062]|uniref:RNA polymerase-associated protein LEO1 n=1 Tax=Thecamonas trahens ATCC 50062 TaxID=461836 RepID=A0A0L0DHH2_THETB|nr:hypothetical protein AMSG_07900 [Thecamonas trahens ATCC 50062]KNC51819.1 hypothetical protein AMSG_07900 [Thecamonas trahens ATCC 50062]|eukprot:XP_013755685.1 hypothetical protein AMSG_07900 [Thecamonas trahens ATCC 50062]